MIKTQTLLNVCDNSGVRFVRCIQIYTGKTGLIYSLILVSVFDIKYHAKIKKGDIFKGIIIRLKRKTHKITGNTIRFNENSIILLNKKNDFLELES